MQTRKNSGKHQGVPMVTLCGPRSPNRFFTVDAQKKLETNHDIKKHDTIIKIIFLNFFINLNFKEQGHILSHLGDYILKHVLY